MKTGAITKTSTLTTTSHKPLEEENPYVWFGYKPMKHCNQTRGKVLVSINADPINIIHTSQQPKKEGLNKELERYFISRKSVN